MVHKEKIEAREKTAIKSTDLSSAAGKGTHLAAVDVNDGRIVRIRPLHWDSKYKPEDYKPWKIKARGKVLEPATTSLMGPFGLVYKKRIYSPNRILYPLNGIVALLAQ